MERFSKCANTIILFGHLWVTCTIFTTNDIGLSSLHTSMKFARFSIDTIWQYMRGTSPVAQQNRDSYSYASYTLLQQSFFSNPQQVTASELTPTPSNSSHRIREPLALGVMLKSVGLRTVINMHYARKVANPPVFTCPKATSRLVYQSTRLSWLI